MPKPRKMWLYDVTVDGKLIYVGISSNTKQRLQSHKITKTVPPTSVITPVCCFETFEEAWAAEKARIQEKKPPLNSHNHATAKERRALEKRRKQIFKDAEYAAWQRECEGWRKVWQEVERMMSEQT